MIVTCNNCSQRIELPDGCQERSVGCPACGNEVFVPRVANVKPSMATRSSVERVQNFILKNPRAFWGIVIGAFLLLALIIHGCSSRYMIAKGDNGIVYRTDRITGETVMIRGTMMRAVQPHKEEAPKKARPLTSSELSKITGRGSGVTSYFSGTVYNGNAGVRITSLRIALTHIDNVGGNYKREYECTTSCDPASSSSFGFSFLRGDEQSDHRYSWYIVSAKGVDID